MLSPLLASCIFSVRSASEERDSLLYSYWLMLILGAGMNPPCVNYPSVPAWVGLKGGDPQPANGCGQAAPCLTALWRHTPTYAPRAVSQPSNVPLTVTGFPWLANEPAGLGHSVGMLYEGEQLFCPLAAGPGISENIHLSQSGRAGMRALLCWQNCSRRKR